MKTVGETVLVMLMTALMVQAASADISLDLIAVLQSDSGGAILIRDCMSPGDLNGDGYSEVFAGELGRSKRLLIFSGGNPPNTTQFVDWGQVRNTMAWIPCPASVGIGLLSSYS